MQQRLQRIFQQAPPGVSAGIPLGISAEASERASLQAPLKPELLAPAGGMEQLQYAILFGADAVYLATERFGLRQQADNFTLEEIPFAVTLAHRADVKVFAACNAYMNDADIKLLPEYLEALEVAGVDALIVSDLGTLRMAKKHAPHVELHVSTQASTTNIEAALAWHELGVSRIVCAREMSLASITDMRKALPSTLELEVFVHGAMCMAISGRCLISDYLTGRSANRGNCTQPCRWAYTLEEVSRPGQNFPVEEDGQYSYIMSSKDLCMLEHLDDLRQAGIDSIKIEGRNKKAFYVATIVNVYRQVLDGADPAFMLPELETVSHRPYSTGFFYGPAEQAINQDAYLQNYDWVAEVVEQTEQRRVRVLCRNRFYEGDILEVLSPHRQVFPLVVRDLCREYSSGEHESVEMANQAMESYSFVSAAESGATNDAELFPHDILRVKRINPAQKN